jgi:arabinosaccharide transport system permease protein
VRPGGGRRPDPAQHHAESAQRRGESAEHRAIRRKNRLLAAGLAALFAVLLVLAFIPLWAIFIGTFQDGVNLVRHGLNLGIDLSQANLNSWRYLFTDSGPYFRWFLNSTLLTIVQVVLTLAISSFVAYGFAMYEFRFKTTLFVAVIILMSIPFEMLMLPLYIQTNAMHLSDNYAGVILPFLASAVTIMFFRQYLRGIPKEIVEAGRIDGLTEYGIFFRLVVPVARPAFAAMAIINALASWNNLLWPLLALRTPAKYTLPIGLNTLLTPYGNNYDLLIVGSFFSMIPILVLFLVFQRFFIAGMTAGAVKG